VDDSTRRKALRVIARRHHPDLGGDVEAYVAAVRALAVLDADGSRAGRRGTVDVRQARAWRRAVRRLRRRLRALRLGRQDHRHHGVDARRRNVRA